MSRQRGRDVFIKYKSFLVLGAKIYSVFPKRSRMWLYNHIRDKKGILRIAQRWMLLKTLAISVGDNVSIHDHVYIFGIENLKIGHNVSIHPMCYIQASGGINIGNDVSIAHGVTLMTENHGYNDLDIPIKDQGMMRKPIIIHNDVWIGAKVTILCGKEIKSGAVVGAGTVVTKNVEKNCIVAGIPNKTIRTRNASLDREIN